MDAAGDADTVWADLSTDLTELILSRLPLRSIILAGVVCRRWRSITAAPTFPRAAAAALRRRPWFFLYGHNNVHPGRNQAFAFDPDAGDWTPLPSPPLRLRLFSGHGGLRFAAAAAAPTRLSFAPLFRGPWRLTSPLASPRCNPLVAVAGARILVAGGARYVGGLVDIEDRLAIEVYDPASDSWELGPPHPAEIGSYSSQWLSSALIAGGKLFFVCGIYSGAVAAFDVARGTWSGVRTLRPPGVLFGFLIASGDGLLLAGICTSPAGTPRFVIWEIDHRTLEFSETGVMPEEILGCLFDADDDDARFASLKCVGLDGLVYVFNDDGHKGYPASVCEVAAGTWRKLPALPSQMNRFHKMVSFCSGVPLHSVLAPLPAGAGDGEE